jgi:hypothetical protein
MGISNDYSSDDIEWQVRMTYKLISYHPIYNWQKPSRVTTWKLSSRERVAVHYLVVRKQDLTGRACSVEYIKQYPERFLGASVGALYVTLDRRRWKGQRYCIEVTCNGIGKWDFRAYDAKSEEITLELVSAVFAK